jgi:hypothetical protein
MKNQENIFKQGHLAHEGLVQTAKYTQTQDGVDKHGVTESALNSTPPIGLNLKLLAENVWASGFMRSRMANRRINAAVLGLAFSGGIKPVQEFLEKDMLSQVDRLNVFDIDRSVIDEVNALNHPLVNAQMRDARDTALPSESQDIVIRDHVGNCCPPEIDRGIDQEAARILKPGGLSVVNITTSELLTTSNRDVVNLADLELMETTLGALFIDTLLTETYHLQELIQKHPLLSSLRSKIVEIGQGGSFVVFGEDQAGHGEWFRSFKSHQEMWKDHGMKIFHTTHRIGEDSHKPPLKCKRHIVVMEKEK